MNSKTYIIVTICAWGIGAIFAKLASNNLGPVMIATITTVMYVVILPFILWATKTSLSLDWNSFLLALASSVFMGIGTLSYYFALQKGAAAETTAATSVYPVITMLLSFAFLGEEFSIKKIIGCLLAVLSVILITQK